MERKLKAALLRYWVAAVTAAVVLLAVLVIDQIENQRFASVREARILRSLSAARARLEAEINERLFLTRGLIAYVSTHPDISVAEFQSLAGLLFAQPGTEGIRSIQLAKDTVVTHVYPLEGNREAIGMKLLDHPRQQPAVQRALDNKTTIVAGPENLVQGGTAFLSRTPIYLTPAGGPPFSGRYWGLATVLIDDRIIFSRAGIALDLDGLEFALRGRDGMGAQGEVFFGDPAIFSGNASVLDIQVPGGMWQLAAVPLPGVLSGSPSLWLIRIGGGSLVVASGVLAFLLTLLNSRRADERLREAARRGEAKFEALAENAQDAIVSADSQGNVLYLNKAGQRLFGYAVDEVLGKPLLLLLDEKFLTENLRIVEQAGSGDGSAVAARISDAVAKKKDGSEFPVEISFGSWTLQGEKFATVVVRDITRRKQIERKLLEHQEQLVGEIADRRQAEQQLSNALAEVERLKEQLEAENVYLRSEIMEEHRHGEIIGASAALGKVLRQVTQVAETDMTVLVLGETGTGKELVARLIYERSARSDRPLVKVNCAALPAELIESELFGHERGAFTGAVSSRVGRFELADNGTIFLDEIGELPVGLQSKLLRVLQEGEFERLGGAKTIKVDVRVIAATNRNLAVEISKGRFRADLYYRLNVYPIHVPPLRERKDDIELLAEVFLQEAQRKLGKSFGKLPRGVIGALQEYDWPGNVRELENLMSRAVVMSIGNVLRLPEGWNKVVFSDSISSSSAVAVADAAARATTHHQEAGNAMPLTLEQIERTRILDVLQQTRWRIDGPKGAALILGLNANTLRSRMRKLGIQRPIPGQTSVS